MARPGAAYPDELSIPEAQAVFEELVDAVAAGKVVHLTERGRRIAVLMPEDSMAAAEEARSRAGA